MIKSELVSSSNITSSLLSAQKIGIPSSGSPIVSCADLTFSEIITTNSSGAFVGQTLTVTNDGGGSGVYGAQSITSWQSATGEVSFEVKYKSKTGTLTAGDVIGILIRQGGVDLVGVAMIPSVGYVYDIIATTTPETGLTMVEDVYTLGLTLNQAAGTATYTDSLGNTGALTVGGGYDNSIYTSVGAVINTSTSNVLVSEYHTSPSAFTLGLSGGWCSYTTSNNIANYPFTSDYEDIISGRVATFGGSDPSISANGISLVSGTDAEIPTDSWPVNDFRMTLRIEGFASNPASASIFNKGGSRLFYLFRESGEIYLGKQGIAVAFFRMGTGAIADVTAATGYTFLIEQTVANGLRFKVDEIGGSNVVDVTDSTAAGKADIQAWESTVDVGHRASLKVIDFNLAEWEIEPI